MSITENPIGNGEVPRTVAFDYIKGQHFRVIHVDGAVGSITPNGHIQMGVYSERHPIPRRLVHKLNPDDSLGSVVTEMSQIRDAIVREMECSTVMTVDVAEQVGKWLLERVAEHKRLSGGPDVAATTERQ